MSDNEKPIIFLAAGNMGLEALYKIVSIIQPLLVTLVTLGQAGVAAVTIFYVLRKIHLLKKNKKDDE